MRTVLRIALLYYFIIVGAPQRTYANLDSLGQSMDVAS
jgi:hypothetical protein